MKKILFAIVMAFVSSSGYAQEEVIVKAEAAENEKDQAVYEIFDVSKRAEFPGGDEGLNLFIAEHIIYPQEALDTGAQGTVNLMFIVNKDGSVSDLTILGDKKGFGLDEEAMRVIKLTSGMWKPALQRDKAVRMRFRIPLKFQLF